MINLTVLKNGANNNIQSKENKVMRKVFNEREYQIKAHEAMKLLANNSNKFATILSVPTGGGKTYMSLKLARELIKEQGKTAFYLTNNSVVRNQVNNELKYYDKDAKVVCLKSGNRVPKLLKDYYIVNWQYFYRHIKEFCELFADKDILLIIDEAHHSCCKGIQEIINKMKAACKNVALLGLTATPFRNREEETQYLGGIFTDGVKDGQVSKDTALCYSVSLKELINSGFLAKPEHITLAGTKIEYHASVNIEDVNEQKKVVYMKTLVEEYKRNKKKYGKTIMFVRNPLEGERDGKELAAQIVSLLTSEGVRAGLAVGGAVEIDGNIINDKVSEANIEKYKAGELDVLVTVQLLSEGVDIPGTKTVFLADNKAKQIDVMQQMGRALRKKDVDNTCYIVSFHKNIKEMVDLAIKYEQKLKPTNVHQVLTSKQSDSVANVLVTVGDLHKKCLGKLKIGKEEYEKIEKEYYYKDSTGDVKVICSFTSNDNKFSNIYSRLLNMKDEEIETICLELNNYGFAYDIKVNELVSMRDYMKNGNTVAVYDKFAVGKVLDLNNYKDLEVQDLMDSWNKELILQFYYNDISKFIGGVVMNNSGVA